MLLLCSASLVLFLVATVMNHEQAEPVREVMLSSEVQSKMHAIAASVAKKDDPKEEAKRDDTQEEAKKDDAKEEAPAQKLEVKATAESHHAALKTETEAVAPHSAKEVNIAHGKMLDEEAPAAAAETGGGSDKAGPDEASDKDGDKAKSSVKEDEFNSPVGNLHPTGGPPSPPPSFLSFPSDRRRITSSSVSFGSSSSGHMSQPPSLIRCPRSSSVGSGSGLVPSV